MAASLKDHPVSEIEFVISKALQDLNGLEFRVSISNMEWAFDPKSPGNIKIEFVCDAVLPKIPF